MEVEDDDFLGVMGGWFPLAFAEGIDRDLRASTGWPPSISADLAVPLGAMMPSIFTAPAIDMRCARPGYTGTTLVTIFRVLLSG